MYREISPYTFSKAFLSTIFCLNVLQVRLKLPITKVHVIIAYLPINQILKHDLFANFGEPLYDFLLPGF